MISIFCVQHNKLNLLMTEREINHTTLLVCVCLLWSVLFKTQLDDNHCEIKLQAVLKTSDVVSVLLSSL